MSTIYLEFIIFEEKVPLNYGNIAFKYIEISIMTFIGDVDDAWKITMQVT